VQSSSTLCSLYNNLPEIVQSSENSVLYLLYPHGLASNLIFSSGLTDYIMMSIKKKKQGSTLIPSHPLLSEMDLAEITGVAQFPAWHTSKQSKTTFSPVLHAISLRPSSMWCGIVMTAAS
jgi:hypothetical protein